MTTPTRGERNNNPGNIDRNYVKWQGMCADQSGDPRFIVFQAAEDGIRAIAKLLLTYHRKYRLNTVRTMIEKWAPSSENDSDAYVNHVAKRLSVNPDEDINAENPDTLELLVGAIIAHENGRVIYTDTQIAESVRRALA